MLNYELRILLELNQDEASIHNQRFHFIIQNSSFRIPRYGPEGSASSSKFQ